VHPHHEKFLNGLAIACCFNPSTIELMIGRDIVDNLQNWSFVTETPGVFAGKRHKSCTTLDANKNEEVKKAHSEIAPLSQLLSQLRAKQGGMYEDKQLGVLMSFGPIFVILPQQAAGSSLVQNVLWN
jgi:hypothetical protein